MSRIQNTSVQAPAKAPEQPPSAKGSTRGIAVSTYQCLSIPRVYQNAIKKAFENGRDSRVLTQRNSAK